MAGPYLAILNQIKQEMKEYYGKRQKDVRRVMTGKKILYI